MSRGYEVAILTSNYRAHDLRGKEPHVDRLLHLESPDHIHYHPQYTLLQRKRARQNRQFVSRAVSGFGPDLIFINGMWNLPHHVAERAEQLLPGKVIYYLASYWPTEPDAHSAYWMDSNSKSWLRLPKKILAAMIMKTWLTSVPRNRLDFRLVLCVSAFMQDYVVREAGVPRERTRIVHNGIELELFAAKQPKNPSPELRLLCAGRLSPDKGTHTVIEGLACLRDAYPAVKFQLSVYGSGTPEYQAHLNALVKKFALQPWIQFRGQVPREQMPAVFKEHDVLLFPSTWSEPLARIVQEAMACGLLVIGTPTGGTREILVDGENGLVFEAGNPQMLAEKIALVANNPGLQARMAQAARRTVEERFTLKRMVDEIEQAFTEVIEEPSYVAH
jgi:glycosyltransferase involved in cell wall biosynthesis